MRMHRGKVRGAILTALGHKLARHYFKWGVGVKALVDEIYDRYDSELPDF